MNCLYEARTAGRLLSGMFQRAVQIRLASTCPQITASGGQNISCLELVDLPEEREEVALDPIRIFVESWGVYRRAEFKQQYSSSGVNSVDIEDGDSASMMQHMPDSNLVYEIVEIINRKGWNLETERELSEKFQELKLRPTDVCEVLKHVQTSHVSVRFFEWAREQPGYRHTKWTYNILAGILGSSQNFEAMKSLLDNMIRDGCTPDNATCGILIKSYGKARCPMKSLEVYQQMQQLGIQPTSIT